MKVAVWHHAVLSGPRIKSPDFALSLFQQQMNALRDSGLSDRADEIHIGVNGPDRDALLAGSLCPERATVFANPDGQSELSTLARLRSWLTPGWAVCYFHMKGVQYPGHPVWNNWRHCMERACLWNWPACVEALERDGFDTAGAHWMSHERYSIIDRSQRYWGGNFWWATAEYLLILPELPYDHYDSRYEAEVWIGKARRRILVRDFVHHFPMTCPP